MMSKNSLMKVVSIFFISFSMLLGADGEKEIPNTDVNENPVREAKIIESNKSADDKKLNLKVTKEFVEDRLLQTTDGGSGKKKINITGVSEIPKSNITIYYNEYSNTIVDFSVNKTKTELRNAIDGIKGKLTQTISENQIEVNGNDIIFPYWEGDRSKTFFVRVKWKDNSSTVYRIKVDAEGGVAFCYGYNNGAFNSNLTSPPLGIDRRNLEGGDKLQYNTGSQINKKIISTNYTLNPSTSLASRVRKLYFEIVGAKDDKNQLITENNVKSGTAANVELKSTDSYFSKSIIKLSSPSWGMSFNLKPTNIEGNDRNTIKNYAAFATYGGFSISDKPKDKNLQWVKENIAFNSDINVTLGVSRTPTINNTNERFFDDRFSYGGSRYFFLKKADFFEVDSGYSDTCGQAILDSVGHDRASIISAIDTFLYDIWGEIDTTTKASYGENNVVAPAGVYSMEIVGELRRPDNSLYFRGDHNVLVDVVDENLHNQTDYLYNQADTSLVTKIDYVYPDYTEGGISFGSKYSDVYFSEKSADSLASGEKIDINTKKDLTCNLDHVHNEKLQLSFIQNQEGEFATLKLTAVGTGTAELSLEEKLANEQQVYTFYLYQGRKVGSEDRIHKKIKYTLKHPAPKDIGTLKMQIDRRVLQYVSSNEKIFVFGNGEFGKLAKKVSLDGYIKLDKSGIIIENLVGSGNINEAVVRDKTKRVYYPNYQYFYFGNDEAGGFSEDIGIKKGVPVASAGDTISIRVNKKDRESLKFYIEDDRGTIFTGIGVIEYVGPTQEGYSGYGQIDMSAGGLNTPHKFTDFGMSEDNILKLEQVSVGTGTNYFIEEKSTIDNTKLIDFFNVFVGEQQVHWANTINDISEIDEQNKCAVVRNELGIAIDKDGNLYLKKLKDEDFDIGCEKGNPITIKYYSVRMNEKKEKYDIKVGEFTLKVMNKKKSFEIDGSNVLDFGKIIQKPENQTVGVRQYFKVKNPDNLNLSYSLDNSTNTDMENKSVSTDKKITMKSIDVKTLTKTDFYVEAEAFVPANSPAGTYQGEVQVIVTVGE